MRQSNSKLGNISWKDLSARIENGKSIKWENYEISQHIVKLNEPTVFMIFHRIKDGEPTLQRDADLCTKLHVALYPVDIEITFNSILDVLKNNNIDRFKVILHSKVDAFLSENEGRQFGKIFTIYLSSADPIEEQKIALKINNAIKNFRSAIRLGGVFSPGKLASDCDERADHRIEGCEFVTGAYPRNEKVTTTLEAESGATSRTGSNLSIILESEAGVDSFFANKQRASSRTAESATRSNGLLTANFGTFRQSPKATPTGTPNEQSLQTPSDSFYGFSTK